MGAAALPVILFTLIWLGVGAVAPYFVPPGPNKKLIQVKNQTFSPPAYRNITNAKVCLGLTGACCWLFWLCCYMSQMNPLLGPELDTKARFAMKAYWGTLHDHHVQE